MLLKNRTISPALEAFMNALAGPFDSADQVESKSTTTTTNNNTNAPTAEIPTIATTFQASNLKIALNANAIDRLSPEASCEAETATNSNIAIGNGAGRVLISPRGALSQTPTTLNPHHANSGVLTASISHSTGSATASRSKESRESKEKSADVCLCADVTLRFVFFNVVHLFNFFYICSIGFLIFSFMMLI
jgi:D-alanyl-D-alanine carboxypeptidase